MTKRIWLVFVALVVIVMAGGYLWTRADDLKDRWVWHQFQAELTTANVTKIEFGLPGKQMALTEAQRGEFLALLRGAAFDRSNRAGNGPTPAAIITLTFQDGRQEQIGMWDFSTYEAHDSKADAKSQFLVRSDALGAWLRNHFQTQTIGAGGLHAPGA